MLSVAGEFALARTARLQHLFAQAATVRRSDYSRPRIDARYFTLRLPRRLGTIREMAQHSKLYFVRSSGAGSTGQQFGLGIFSILAGAFTLFLGSAVGSFLLGSGILMLFASYWAKANPIIQLEEDHFDMKAGMIAARELVLYRDIVSVTEESAKKAYVLTKSGKKIRIPLFLLPDDRRAELCDELRRRSGVA